MKSRRTFILCLMVCAVSVATTGIAKGEPRRWDLNDVSYLFPLPSVGEPASLLLGAKASGRLGQLIPEALHKKLPDLLRGGSATTKTYNQLRLVSFRVDPCNPVSLEDRTCRRQVRMVWQPLVKEEFDDGQTAWVTEDAGFHTIYEMGTEEFKGLSTELQKLKDSSGVSTTRKRLDIHPALQSEGLAGPFMKGLNRTLLKFCGADNLKRVTFMQLNGRGNVWSFGAFNVKDGALVDSSIPRIDAHLQTFFNGDDRPREFRAALVPAPPGRDVFNQFIENQVPITTEDSPLLKKAMQASDRIENPTIHSSQTIDCATCHISQSVRSWIQREFKDFYRDAANHPWIYRNSSFNLVNRSPVRALTNNVRAFGYLNTEVAISQRTINESAAVAEKMVELDY